MTAAGTDMRLKIPEKVNCILDTLRRHGHEAYAVGGCVRDSILAREPDDWDITTSAKPEEVKACFRRTVDTGIAHGTVTVLIGDEGFEVTTYRIDGTYSDGRHPDAVRFTPELKEDLRRRDFTINAMAYSAGTGLIDLYGGMADLQKKKIRCVGDPDARFGEDALRVLRAVRFAAQLGFSIDADTREAIKRHAGRLAMISAERIQTELVKLITSPHPEFVGELYTLGITEVILPEFDEAMRTEQNTKHHMYSVGMHTVKAMCEIPCDKVLRLTMLLHDLGKPAMKRTDRDGVDHFRGHAEYGARMADGILRRLKFDNDTRKRVVHLIRFHDMRPGPYAADVRRAAARIGRENFEDYLAVQWADNMAKSPYRREEKLERINSVYRLYREITARGDCLSVRELAVDGTDLLALGARGEAIGALLARCLEEVLAEPEKNDRVFLLGLCRSCLEMEHARTDGRSGQA